MSWRKPADRLLAHSIVQAFRGDAERSFIQLSTASSHAWEKTEYWLNTSGLAFYFLDQITSLGISDAVHSEVFHRLRANLRKNKVRAAAMFREFAALNGAFRSAGVMYFNHKGFTLCPHACPSPELRHQLDFDFIVAREHLEAARECLDTRGYRLTAATHKTWEFKAGNYARRKWDLYSMGTYRSVELHFGGGPERQNDERLQRISNWTWGGQEYPALAPADQLIGQALHLFGHLRSESTRPAWVLEFRRHVIARRDDCAFWANVRQLATDRRYAAMALGTSILLASQLFGRCAPPDVERWAIASVTPTVRLWVERYGVDAVLADFPGTKLFLFLEEEIERLEAGPAKAVRTRLLPMHAGRMIFTARASETRLERMDRIWAQIRFMLFRARFHLVEAGHYLAERHAWKRALLRQRVGSAVTLQAGREMTNHKQLNDNLGPTSV
ncbi:MAG TPA: nucleotidyltransferase family protein [Acidobacteriaceae bacterium]|nr:nucleotidyltransferase family protein [Acidobacteriaceae bacterium]